MCNNDLRSRGANGSPRSTGTGGQRSPSLNPTRLTLLHELFTAGNGDFHASALTAPRPADPDQNISSLMRLAAWEGYIFTHYWGGSTPARDVTLPGKTGFRVTAALKSSPTIQDSAQLTMFPST